MVVSSESSSLFCFPRFQTEPSIVKARKYEKLLNSDFDTSCGCWQTEIPLDKRLEYQKKCVGFFWEATKDSRKDVQLEAHQKLYDIYTGRVEFPIIGRVAKACRKEYGLSDCIKPSFGKSNKSQNSDSLKWGLELLETAKKHLKVLISEGKMPQDSLDQLNNRICDAKKKWTAASDLAAEENNWFQNYENKKKKNDIEMRQAQESIFLPQDQELLKGLLKDDCALRVECDHGNGLLSTHTFYLDSDFLCTANRKEGISQNTSPLRRQG